MKKWKYLNMEPKMPYLGIFGLEFLKNIVLFEINTLKFVKKWVFNSYRDFCYRIFGIRFSQTSGVCFVSRSSDPGSVPLYKVCQLGLTRGITQYACICPRKGVFVRVLYNTLFTFAKAYFLVALIFSTFEIHFLETASMEKKT